MSTENNTPVESTVTDDLNDFSDELFGRSAPAEESTNSEEAEDQKTEDEAQPEKGKEAVHDGDDTPADDDDDTDDEADPKEAPKQKKSRYQERIDELTSKAREAERREKAAQDRLDAIEAKLNKTDAPKQANDAENLGPQPTDVDENGDDIYPLGEFDPQYIRALTKFTIQQEREAAKLEDSRNAEQKATEAAKTELQVQWTAKLEPAKERYPDFVEKGTELLSTFDSISPSYGEYLESTIMSMEYGTDVLYYLANNPQEAKRIVDSGAAKATIALGRIEAKFLEDGEQQVEEKKVTKAPTPPRQVNKGSSSSIANVPDDTDDLDAFTTKLFSKKR